MAMRLPLRRRSRPDIVHPTMENMIDVALERMHYVLDTENTEPPPIIFPLAESMRWDFFAQGDWDEFGNLESEYGRLAYTLARYPERGPPVACEKHLLEILEGESVLTAWSHVASALASHAMAVLNEVCQQQRHGLSEDNPTSKSGFLALPVDYKVSDRVSNITTRLWRRSLTETALHLAEGQTTHLEQFLQIHAFLKDPIHWFRKPFERQLSIFERIFEKWKATVPITSVSTEMLERVAAQGAQETAFLSSPLIERACLIHFRAHHQLTYASIALDSLARAEFSVPWHVLEVVEEMMLAVTSNNGQACHIVPILVTARPSSSKDDGYLIPIIDGNHRATAALLLRFLASQEQLLDRDAMIRGLLTYCIDHQLGRKWQLDLTDVLIELYTDHNSHLRDQLTSQRSLLRVFANVQNIPALIVQEEDFHTICKQRSVGKSRPVLLHPFHQTLFNDDELPFALPQKAGQTHGRPAVFRLMPLTPFSACQDADSSEEFKAVVRESMNGLTRVSPHVR